MQRLIWIGSPFFANELSTTGWQQVFVHNFEDLRVYSWDDLVRLAGFEPDVLVVADKSRPPFVLGMEEFPCLTVFYSVDSHIHSWESYYAQAFDACLVSLKDHIPLFCGPFLDKSHVWWSPPFAKMGDVPDPTVKEIWDCLFVGNTDKTNMPKRTQFLKELGEKIPSLKIMQGDYARLYPQSKILVNQAEKDDLNFRVFEAMGCGGCLVTPRIGHGLADLFVDGEQAVFYKPNDAGDAAYRINFLLKHPEVREHIALAAQNAIDENHREIHRAQAFTDHLCDLYMEGPENVIENRRSRASEIRQRSLAIPYLLWANEIDDINIKESYLAAAKGKFGLSGIIE